MEEKVIFILSKNLELNKDEINNKLNIDNCSNWDSLKTLFIVSDLEEEFNINLDPAEIEIMKSYNSIIDVLKNHFNELQ